MAFLLLVPALLSLVILCAHLLRSGMFVLLPVLFMLLPLLLVPKGWVARLWQLVLGLAILEWIRSAIFLAGERVEAGEPWLRPVLILGGVAVLAFVAALLFESRGLLEVYPRRPLG